MRPIPFATRLLLACGVAAVLGAAASAETQEQPAVRPALVPS